MSRPASTRPDAGRMYRAVSETVKALQPGPEHSAIVQLAREVARALDAAETAGRGADAYHKLGPRMISVLRELGATPAAARRPAGGEDDDDRPAPGDDAEVRALQQRADDRRGGAPAVDPAAP